MRKSKDTKNEINKRIREYIKDSKTYKWLASRLGASRQTVKLWVKEYMEQGTIVLRTNKAHNKYPDEFNNRILDKYDARLNDLKSRFGDVRVEGLWLPTIRYFQLADRIDCSGEHVRKTLIQNHRITARMNRDTRRSIKKSLKAQIAKANTEEELKTLTERIEVITNNKYQGKTGMDGYRVEVDGCFDHWISKDKHCLYFAVDSFSGTLLNIHVEKQETNIGYMKLFKGVFEKHGKPAEVRTDKRNGLSSGAVCDELRDLDIDVTSSTEPTFKPNVERAFQSAQNLLPNLLMDWGIDSVDKLLEKKEDIIEFYNSYHKLGMIEDNCLINMSNDELDSFIIKSKKKGVNTISHVSIEGKKYAPYSSSGQRVYTSKNNIIHEEDHGIYFIKQNGVKYYLKEIKDIIEDSKTSRALKEIMHERRKNRSFAKHYTVRALEVNKKIKELNSVSDYQMTPIEITL